MEKWWNGYPWRVIQPNFREIDTRDFDEEKFLEELEAFSCNAVMLNAAGLIASYPTELADHTRSAYLEGFDLKGLVDRCHERGIRVIARTDFSKIPRAVFERHPDWAYRHADGSELDYNGYVQTCLLGGYQGGYMDEILREMFRMIPFDGIYCNMGSATGYIVDYSMKRHGPCQCDACKAAFKAASGMDVPTELRPGDRASMVYFGFQQKIASAQKKRITSLLREISPDLAYCSIDYSRQEAHTDFGAELPAWQYQAASAARMMRGMNVEATVANVDFMGFAYRHPSCTGALQELRLWQTLANHGGIDYYVIGRLYDKTDKSTFDRVKKVFAYAAEHEKEMYGVQSVSDVLLVRDSYIIPDKEERGWVRMLTELHILFDETLGGGLAAKDLSAYKAVILPGKGRLQPPVIEKLNAYAEAGGIVITDGPMSALACCGVEQPGKPDTHTEGAMFLVREEEKQFFPSFEQRNIMIVGDSYIPRAYAEGTEFYGAYLQPERFGPPELCYATEAPTQMPALTRHAYGKGYGLCLPWQPGTDYYRDGHESWRLFVGDLLEHLCGIRPAGTQLSPMVEVTRGRKEDFEVVHFVNGSGHFGNSCFEPPVLTDQTVEIPWPYETARCENLDEPGNVRCRLEDGRLTLTIPALGFHACVI
ncbi:MAG: beta-galactosidase trimerization domain-containing protein, partial [Lachnospiraceae bacterium]|nr:beta-galactosidase trimerization domain-containing protein [Lachnospiraceae bacterium]